MLLLSNPWMLSGLLFISAPILIHLFSRQKVQVMEWAAMRFIKDIVEQQQKKMKCEDLLLLVLRCLLIALVALALARPAIKDLDMAWLGGDGAAVLILDDSRSMATTDGSMTRVQRAQQRSQTLIQTAPDNLGMALGLGRRTPIFPIAEFSKDRALMLETLQNHQPSPWDVSAEALLRQGLAQLKTSQNPAKTLFLVSDFQHSQWAKPSASLKELLKTTQDSVHLVFIPVGEDRQNNVALSKVTLVGGTARLGQHATIRADLFNHDPKELQQRSLSLWIGDDMVQQSHVSIGPQQSSSVFFRYHCQEEGLLTATVRLEEDDNAIDDTAKLGFRVREKQPILIVHDQEPSEDEFTEITFWEFALNPYEERDRDPRALYDIEHIDSSSLSNTVLEDYGYVIFNEVSLISPSEADIVENYLKSGGGAIFFWGDQTDPSMLNSVLYREGQGPMRYPLKDKPLLAEKESQIPWTLKAKGHPIWNDLAGGQVDHLSSWNWHRCHPFERQEYDTSHGSVIEYIEAGNNNDCVAYEVSYGQGRAIFIGTGSGTRDHNLALTAAWPTFVGQTSAHLMENRRRDRSIHYGDTWFTELPTSEAQSTFQVRSPNGSMTSITAIEHEGSYQLSLPVVNELGIYRIQNTSRDEQPWQISVGLSAGEEGAIDAMNKDELENIYGDHGVVIDSSPELLDALSAMKAAPDFSIYLLVLAALTLLAEQFLGHRIHQRSRA